MLKNKIKIWFCLLFAVFIVLIMTTNSMAQSWIEERSVDFREGGNLVVTIPLKPSQSSQAGFNTQKYNMWIDNMWGVDIIDVGYNHWAGKYWRLIDWLNAANVYCIQHGKSVNSTTDSQTKPGAFFHFSMNESYGENYYTEGYTFATGNHVRDYIDGQWMAYLFSCNRTDPKGYNNGDYKDDGHQNIIWNEYKTQMDKAQRAGIVADIGSIDSNTEHPSSDYKHYYETNAFLSYKQTWADTPVQSNYRNITVNAGDQYTLVGPLNVSYPSGNFEGKQFGGLIEGKGSRIKLYDKSGNEISSNYWDLVDIWGNVISLPNSDADFYIRFSTKSTFIF